MSEVPSYQRLFAELKRRNVFRVAAVYGATAFVIIEASDLIFPRIPLPEWTIALVVWLALLGFPIALVLAWAYEKTPDGMRATDPAETAELDRDRSSGTGCLVDPHPDRPGGADVRFDRGPPVHQHER